MTHHAGQFCLPPPPCPLCNILQLLSPPTYTSPTGLTSAWFTKPPHCRMISTVMLSPPHGRKNDGDRVAIATPCITTRVYSHSKARVILTKCKSNHVHSAHSTYGDSQFIQYKNQSSDNGLEGQQSRHFTALTLPTTIFPSAALCFSNSALAIPQTCLTCSCLRAFVHTFLFT